MTILDASIQGFDWAILSQNDAWEAWREAKIAASLRANQLPPVAMDSLSDPSDAAISELRNRSSVANMALYQAADHGASVEAASEALASFGRRMGFARTESHRSEGHARVVALRTSSDEAKAGYIPYTRRAMNWHTDGYYNRPETPVQGFILHCYQQAMNGGENQLIDPEVAYLRMREADPEYVRSMMHPQAMTIPENVEPDGSVRPASVGPVFFADRATGRLQMRYTARTRSIAWRDDPVTQAAVDWLRDWLGSQEPLMLSVRLLPGQGLVSNNVLHNRTGFEDGQAAGGERIVLRVRYHERAGEN
jgi:hypothetical protein